jgi:hypothetical protein
VREVLPAGGLLLGLAAEPGHRVVDEVPEQLRGGDVEGPGDRAELDLHARVEAGDDLGVGQQVGARCHAGVFALVSTTLATLSILHCILHFIATCFVATGIV